MKALVAALGVYSSLGGEQRYAATLVRGLAGVGADTTVVALWDRRADVAHAPDPARFVACGGRKLRCVRAVAAALVRERPAVIVLGHVLLAPLALLAKLLRPRARVLLVVYGLEVWDPPAWVRRILVRRAVDGVIAVSDYTARATAAGYGLPRSRFALLPPAVDPPPVSRDDLRPSKTEAPRDGLNPAAPHDGHEPAVPPRDGAGWPADAGPRILSVTRLGAHADGKGIDVVLRALPRVLAAIPGVRYEVIGDGEGRAALEERARSLGVASAVRFRGAVSDAARDEAYRSADVFVLPSTQEGFGIVFIEAWRHALPVVAADAAAASEVVGERGVLVPPGDDAALAEALIALLSDPDRRRALGAAGRAAVARYSVEAFAGRLRSILERAAGPHGATGEGPQDGAEEEAGPPAHGSALAARGAAR